MNALDDLVKLEIISVVIRGPDRIEHFADGNVRYLVVIQCRKIIWIYMPAQAST